MDYAFDRVMGFLRSIHHSASAGVPSGALARAGAVALTHGVAAPWQSRERSTGEVLPMAAQRVRAVACGLLAALAGWPLIDVIVRVMRRPRNKGW